MNVLEPDTLSDDEDSFSDDSDSEDDSIRTAVKVRDLLADGISMRKIPVESLNKYITSYIALDTEHRSVQDQTKHHLSELSKLYKASMNHKNNEVVFQKKLEELEKIIIDKEKDVKTKVEELAQMMNEVQDRDSRMTELRHDIEQKRVEYEDLKKKAEESGKPIINKYQRQVDLLSVDISSIENEISFEEGKRENFHGEIEEMKGKLKDVAVEIERERVFYETERTNLYQEKNKFLLLRSEMTACKLSLENIESEVTDLEEESVDVVHCNQKMVEVAADVSKKIKTHEKELKELRGEIKRYGNTKATEEKYNRQLLTMEEMLSASLQESRSFIESQNERIRRSMEKIDQLRREQSKKQKKLEFLRKSNNDFRKEVERVKSKEVDVDMGTEGVKQVIRDLETEMQIAINKVLRVDRRRNGVVQKYGESVQDVFVLEKRVDGLKRDERDQIERKRKLERDRDLIFRGLTKEKMKFVKTVGQIKQLRFQHVELKKKFKEIKKENELHHKKYEKIQKERNTYVKEISQSRAVLEQKRHNLKLLENEQRVFKKSVEEKDKMLRSIVNDNKSLKDRIAKETLRLNEETIKMKHINKAISEYENEAKKLTSCITHSEGEMSESKGKLEVHINERNLIGNQLIDLSDELAILHEKFSKQKKFLSEGEAKLSKLELEEKSIQIVLNGESTKLEAKLRQIPIIKEQVIERENLIEEIGMCQDRIIDLRVEDPKRRKIVNLISKPIDEEKMKEEIGEMNKTMKSQQDSIYEKNLFLKELNQSVGKLEEYCSQGRIHSFKVSEKINSVQGMIKNQNKENMSLLAELSVFKLKHVKTSAKNKAMKKYLLKLEKCKKPPEDIQKEVGRRKIVSQSSNRIVDDMGTRRNGPEPRPNSYLDEDGIAKYYMFRPVMYNSKSAQMRHYRKK